MGPSEFITEEALNKSSAKWIPKGSILVALAGQGKTKGMAAQLMFDSTCNQSMCAVVPDAKLNAEYLHWWLHANYQNIRNLAGGDLRDGLNLEMIGSIKCPLPPYAEQVAISNYLKNLRNNNSKLIEKCRHSIDLLKEHRTSLISATVTGKIDVRELV
jgi:type I restriction enzyme S subunit